MHAFLTAVRRTAVFVDHWQLLVLAVCAPAWLFPSPGRTIIWLALPLLWLAAGLANQSPLPRTPLNSALLLLSAMLLINIFITFDLVLSLPKVAGILLGIALFFSIV